MVGVLSSKLLLSSFASKPVLLSSVATLSGGGALSGVLISETTNNYGITSQLKNVGSPISSFLSSINTSSSSSTGDYSSIFTTFFTSTVPNFFQTIGNFISSQAQSLKTSVETSYNFAKGLGVSLQSFQDLQFYILGLKHSAGDGADFSELFEGVQDKIPSLISFFMDDSKSESFKKLFKGEELQKTIKTMKILSGNDSSVKSVITAERGLVAALINSFAKEPVRISKKIERLVKLVDKAGTQGRSSGTGGDVSQQQSSGGTPYELTKEKLKSFLKDRKEGGQEGFEIGLIAEIAAKQQGITLPSSTSNFFALLGTLTSVLSETVTSSS